MIKKIFGMLAAAAILALLVLTVLHHDNYRSMIRDGSDFGPVSYTHLTLPTICSG